MAFQSIGAYRRTDAAVVSIVKLNIVFFFPPVTDSRIQYFFSFDPGFPVFSGQSAGRASIDARAAGAAISTIERRPVDHGHVCKNRSQAHPGSVRAGHQLAMAADPT